MTVCEHACDCMMASRRICSTWGRVFCRGVYSCHCCSTCFSRRCCAMPRNASPPMQSSWTAWCSSNEVRKRREGRHRLAKSTRRGGGSPHAVGDAARRRCRRCVTITGRVGGDDDGDRDYVCGVRAYGLGGQDGDHVPANVIWAGGAIQSLQPARCTNSQRTDEFVYLGGGISANRHLRKCRGNASNPESMAVLRAT